ncbi:hypothetical protein JLDGIFFK_00001 [Klebsiella phage vB_KppS-Samwise]|uniref:Uncharacterized protein n=1 Tax=Klebsiella phage vB_KppS-Samwise TaxID=2762815 RepID=A0A7R8MKF2_9CAUD|nr:hypothetical protein JLDGIFFK_00001 [Klebsiella phage vB_KppS-Samwise]CAD5239391.1 hypothetical protein EONHMLJF_00001 [Klebsiella phage vB_KaS-Gatomon]CAJ1038895.1 hypothetical protein SAMARA_00001 [Klebsiella phage vB_KppS-Samwise]
MISLIVAYATGLVANTMVAPGRISVNAVFQFVPYPVIYPSASIDA